MQRTLKFDLSQVLFTQTELNVDPTPHLLEPEESICKCGLEKAELLTQDDEMICPVCASTGENLTIVDAKERRIRIKTQIKIARRFIHEGSLYLQYAKNFISSNLYERMLTQYYDVYASYIDVCSKLEEQMLDTELVKQVEELVKDVKILISNQDTDREMKRVHIHMLKQLLKNEDPSDTKVQVISTFYTMPEYNLIKDKIFENDELNLQINELKSQLQRIKMNATSKTKFKRERKYFKKNYKLDYRSDMDEIQMNKILIFVRVPGGKLAPLKVDQYDKISYIKSRLAEEEGIDINNQNLSFRCKELSDDKLLSDYKIQNKSILKLKLKSCAKEETLEIHTDDGVKYMLQASLNSPIFQIKAEIDSKFSTSIGEKNLVLNGKVLNNRRTLEDYNYTQGDILYLEENKIIIHVQCENGKLFNISAKEDISILDFKEILKKEGTISSTSSKLFFNGSELKCLYKTLKQCCIQQNSKIYAF